MPDQHQRTTKSESSPSCDEKVHSARENGENATEGYTMLPDNTSSSPRIKLLTGGNSDAGVDDSSARIGGARNRNTGTPNNDRSSSGSTSSSRNTPNNTSSSDEAASFGSSLFESIRSSFLNPIPISEDAESNQVPNSNAPGNTATDGINGPDDLRRPLLRERNAFGEKASPWANRSLLFKIIFASLCLLSMHWIYATQKESSEYKEYREFLSAGGKGGKGSSKKKKSAKSSKSYKWSTPVARDQNDATLLTYLWNNGVGSLFWGPEKSADESALVPVVVGEVGEDPLSRRRLAEEGKSGDEHQSDVDERSAERSFDRDSKDISELSYASPIDKDEEPLTHKKHHSSHSSHGSTHHHASHGTHHDVPHHRHRTHHPAHKKPGHERFPSGDSDEAADEDEEEDAEAQPYEMISGFCAHDQQPKTAEECETIVSTIFAVNACPSDPNDPFAESGDTEVKPADTADTAGSKLAGPGQVGQRSENGYDEDDYEGGYYEDDRGAGRDDYRGYDADYDEKYSDDYDQYSDQYSDDYADSHGQSYYSDKPDRYYSDDEYYRRNDRYSNRHNDRYDNRDLYADRHHSDRFGDRPGNRYHSRPAHSTSHNTSRDRHHRYLKEKTEEIYDDDNEECKNGNCPHEKKNQKMQVLQKSQKNAPRDQKSAPKHDDHRSSPRHRSSSHHASHPKDSHSSHHNDSHPRSSRSQHHSNKRNDKSASEGHHGTRDDHNEDYHHRDSRTHHHSSGHHQRYTPRSTSSRHRQYHSARSHSYSPVPHRRSHHERGHHRDHHVRDHRIDAASDADSTNPATPHGHKPHCSPRYRVRVIGNFNAPEELPNMTGCFWDQDNHQLYFRAETTREGENSTLMANKSILAACKVAEYESMAFRPLIFIMAGLFLSCGSQILMKYLPFEFPHSVVLLLLGMAMSAVADTNKDSVFGMALWSMEHIDPKIIFWVLLPPLLYEDSSTMNWHVGKRVMLNSLLLAVPGALVNTMLTGCFIRLCFSSPFPETQNAGITLAHASGADALPGTGGDDIKAAADAYNHVHSHAGEAGAHSTLSADHAHDGHAHHHGNHHFGTEPVPGAPWPWSSAFLLGAILSATDPVAVIAALNELHAPAKLSLLISGEALLNDGSGVVLFEIFWHMAKHGTDFVFMQALGEFCWLSFGGPILGILISFVVYWLLQLCRGMDIAIVI